AEGGRSGARLGVRRRLSAAPVRPALALAPARAAAPGAARLPLSLRRPPALAPASAAFAASTTFGSTAKGLNGVATANGLNRAAAGRRSRLPVRAAASPVTAASSADSRACVACRCWLASWKGARAAARRRVSAMASAFLAQHLQVEQDLAEGELADLLRRPPELAGEHMGGACDRLLGGLFQRGGG